MKSYGYAARGIAGAALAFCLLSSACNARAQDKAALAARLHATATASSIDTADITPWHLKLDVQLYDAKGKPTEQGTVEEWWVNRYLNRVTYTMPSYTGTQLINKDGEFQTKGRSYEPAILDDVLEQVVHPMPYEENIDDAKPDLRKEKFGKTDLECIMLDQPLTSVPFPPLGLFPTYCLDTGKDSLRITTEVGSLLFYRNRLGLFQGRSVVVDLVGHSDGIEVVSAHVSELATTTLTVADFVPGDDMESVKANSVRVGTGVIAGYALSTPQPRYPEESKQNHVSGVVVLHALIGRDGRIRSLRIISTPNADLAMASIVAVKKWIYKPYLLLGEPTEVETTININFTFGPG